MLDTLNSQIFLPVRSEINSSSVPPNSRTTVKSSLYSVAREIKPHLDLVLNLHSTASGIDAHVKEGRLSFLACLCSSQPSSSCLRMDR